VDVRIIAATNRRPEQEVADGRFRQDLYFRLNVLNITLPPLRDRGRDVLLLAEYLLKKYCQQFGLPERTLSAPAQNALLAYAWPGNVRELENVIQKAILLSTSAKIPAEAIQFGGSIAGSAAGAPTPTTLKEARCQAERDIICRTLAKTAGNISLTAKILEIDRKWLMKIMEELGISAVPYRGSA
jgi:DNA-binding NtrC family response regulator